MDSRIGRRTLLHRTGLATRLGLCLVSICGVGLPLVLSQSVEQYYGNRRVDRRAVAEPSARPAPLTISPLLEEAPPIPKAGPTLPPTPPPAAPTAPVPVPVPVPDDSQGKPTAPASSPKAGDNCRILFVVPIGPKGRGVPATVEGEVCPVTGSLEIPGKLPELEREGAAPEPPTAPAPREKPAEKTAREPAPPSPAPTVVVVREQADHTEAQRTWTSVTMIQIGLTAASTVLAVCMLLVATLVLLRRPQAASTLSYLIPGGGMFPSWMPGAAPSAEGVVRVGRLTEPDKGPEEFNIGPSFEEERQAREAAAREQEQAMLRHIADENLRLLEQMEKVDEDCSTAAAGGEPPPAAEAAGPAR